MVAIFSLIAFSATAQTTVTLAWNGSPDASVVSYNLYYKAISATNLSVASVPGTNVVISVQPYVLYEYFVTAVNNVGLESDTSNKIRTEMMFINGNGKPTFITLLDVGTTNFPLFQLVLGVQNGTLTGTPPNLTYTPTNNIGKDFASYASPEQFAGSNVVDYYILCKATNRPPNIFLLPK
jgi:hypothetical protein